MTYEDILLKCLYYHVTDIALNGTTKYETGCVVVNGGKEKWCLNCGIGGQGYGPGCNKKTCVDTQKINLTHTWLERKECNYWECSKCGVKVNYIEYPPCHSMTCEEAIMRKALL